MAQQSSEFSFGNDGRLDKVIQRGNAPFVERQSTSNHYEPRSVCLYIFVSIGKEQADIDEIELCLFSCPSCLPC